MKLIGVLGATALSMLTANVANAAVTVNIHGSGANVFVKTTGSLDLTGLTVLPNAYYLQTGLSASSGYVGTGAGSHQLDTDPYTLLNAYSGLTGPASFGTGSFTYADTGAGDAFGLNASSFGAPYVFVPLGYVSGTALSSSATFLGQSIASLGLTTGSYVYSSGTDSVTINISAVPEPRDLGDDDHRLWRSWWHDASPRQAGGSALLTAERILANRRGRFQTGSGPVLRLATLPLQVPIRNFDTGMSASGR